ncbi:T9SS type A sorting domain-containing protein [candidate division KSB1 bacterium]|nr:T9SS type A sorting domain-containing protein [candidate division KSB1 bacterium]
MKFAFLKFRPGKILRDCSSALSSMLIFLTVFSIPAFAQIDMIYVQGDGPYSVGNLNNAIEAVISSGNLSNTVFELNLNSRYIINRSIIVPAGERLTLIAPEAGMTSETAPPQILWSDWLDISNWPDVPEKYFMISVYGDLEMHNIWVYFADTAGVQMGTPIVFDGDTTGLTGDKEEYGTFENCIFDFMPCPWRTASGVICVRSKHFNGTFRGCYFRNCVDRHFTYYGRAVSFPFYESGYHIDNVSFENCTFANIGYVYMQESTNYGENVQFNHCTFLNIVMFSLESGWWHKLSVTNSLWVNGYMLGQYPAQVGLNPNGGTIRIDSVSTFGFEVRFTEQDRRILFAHNSYFIEDWLADWMANSPHAQELRRIHSEDLIPVPQPMLNQKTLAFFESDSFPYMNLACLYDSTDPNFHLPPSDTSLIKDFLYIKWHCGLDSLWAWHPEYSTQYRWPLVENLAYTNATLLNAAMNGFPLGDLYRWFPDQYEYWNIQADEERTDITYWLENGVHPDSILGIERTGNSAIPSQCSLSQNYPNPFNAVTKINYQLPVTSQLTIKVYDVRGREVATLYEGIQIAGIHSINFNGDALASAIYLYQLKAGDFVTTKKFILLK